MQTGDIEKILQSGILSGYRAYPPYDDGGEYVKKFEREFKSYIGSKHALAFNSATSALHTALLACGIGAGDRVLTSPLTFSASASCIKMVGAEVVFGDVHPHTYCLAEWRSDVQAIIPVHWWGYPTSTPKGVKIIEDATQAIGATRNGKMVGTFGDCGVFSFNQHKHINTGEGGMLVTDDDEIAEKAKLIRNHGETQSMTLGYNYRMTEITAAIGLEGLRNLDSNLKHRRKLCQILTEGLSNIRDLTPPFLEDGCEHSYYCYAVRTPHRDEIQAKLAEKGIYFGKGGLKPLHLLPFYGGGSFPEAERVYKEVMFTDIIKSPTPSEAFDIIREIKGVL